MRAKPEVFDPREAENARAVLKEVAVWEESLLTTALPSGEAPQTYFQALGSIDERETGMWSAAFAEELESFEKNEMAEVVPRERGMRVVGSRWVFDVKDRQAKLAEQSNFGPTFKQINGDWKRARARGVAKGFMQIYNVNYTKTYAPTPTSTEVRLMLMQSLSLGFEVHQMDVKAAFLIPKLKADEVVFMEPLPGSGVPKDHVWRLKSSLYGLKQAANYFYNDAKATLTKLGYVNEDIDAPCLFVHRDQGGEIDCLILVHVDDFAIATPMRHMEKRKEELKAKYDMKDLGRLRNFLGMEITWDSDGKGVRLSQRGLTEEFEKMTGQTNCRKTSTPMEEKLELKLAKPEQLSAEENREMESRKEEYGRAVGTLGYLAEWTRPEITQATNYVRRFNSAPTKEAWQAVCRLGRYMETTLDYGLHFRVEDLPPRLEGFVDADFAFDKEEYKSTSGYVVRFGNTALSWGSKKQDKTARSTLEAEIISLDEGARKALWLRRVAKHVGLQGDEPLTLREDHTGAEGVFNSEQVPTRTKYMATKYFATKQDVEEGKLRVDRIDSGDNIADAFTKPLGRTKFEFFRGLMGVVCVAA